MVIYIYQNIVKGLCTMICSDQEALFVRTYRPQNDHMERSDLAKRFFIARWERERTERVKRERERGAGA
jgi:hypothetical protein